MHRGYRLLWRLLVLPMLGWLWWRGRKEPGYRRHVGQRLGFIHPAPESSGCLLIHAASAGEMQATLPLIQALRTVWPDHALVVSTQTPTGAQALHAQWNGAIQHVYLPFDTPGATARFLDRLQPRLLILTERELWPELLLQCRRRAIPVVLLNARLSEHSLRSYQRWHALMDPVWSQLACVCATDTASLERYRSLGVPAQRLVLAGNLKFDALLPEHASPPPPWADGATVVVAGSTHEFEEEQLLPAWKSFSAHHPDALLILVPRHPQRFEAVARRLDELGLVYARHSRGETPGAGVRILLGDSMGELVRWYRLATACFIGGTLAPIGGHNALEAMALGKPVLFGPHTENFQNLYEEIERSGAGLRIGSADELFARVQHWTETPEEWARSGQAAQDLVLRHQGATRRHLDAIRPLWHVSGEAHRTRIVQQVVWPQTLWHDPALLDRVEPATFEPPAPDDTSAQRLATGSGRGQAHLIQAGGQALVLRHYRRGGWIARLSPDRYARTSVANSRAMREYALLRLMRSWNLPVPQPVAARHWSHGWLYSADILVAMIPDTRNVAQMLSQERPPAQAWHRLGSAIRQLHDHQVFHSDLNCHNLLLDGSGQAWIVDFDKCALRPGDTWKPENLARLLRSLRKELGRLPVFHWHEADWEHLLQGYNAPEPKPT